MFDQAGVFILQALIVATVAIVVIGIPLGDVLFRSK